MKQVTAIIIALTILLVFTQGCDKRGHDGAQGVPGLNGEPGATGPQGDPGADGSQGPPGADANGITVVPLCGGTTSYPSTFVEVAFCIDHNLYATYSTHGGFSTLIPPGTYRSNGVNSDCTFTVLDNCQVVF